MRSLKSQAWALVLFFLDTCVLSLRALVRCLRASPAVAGNRRQRLILVRPDALGDFVIWSATFETLRRLYPQERYEWVWIGTPAQAGFARLFDLFDQLIVVNTTRFRSFFGVGYRLQTLWRLCNVHSDILIHPIRSREFLIGDAIARAIPAKHKFASRGDLTNSANWQLRLADRFYTQVFPFFGGGSELDFTADFASKLSGGPSVALVPDLRQLAGNAPASAVAERYFLVLPGAGWEGREWGVERFIEASERIQRQKGWLAVWAGSEAEQRRFSNLVQKSQVRSHDRMGKTSVHELLGLIAGAEMVLCNETGGAHLAAACSVPSLVITGGGHFERFAPWGTMRVLAKKMPCFGCNWHCIYPFSGRKPVPCIDKIEMEQVLQAVREL